MRRVIIESPYRGDVFRNVQYAARCIQDSIRRGEAPFASHLFYTQFLDDADPVQRERGLLAGFSWSNAADLCAVYNDLGISPGMLRGINNARRHNLQIEFREIGLEDH